MVKIRALEADYLDSKSGCDTTGLVIFFVAVSQFPHL